MERTTIYAMPSTVPVDAILCHLRDKTKNQNKKTGMEWVLLRVRASLQSSAAHSRNCISFVEGVFIVRNEEEEFGGIISSFSESRLNKTPSHLPNLRGTAIGLLTTRSRLVDYVLFWGIILNPHFLQWREEQCKGT
ncbi:hypothetical protein J6590_085786 [Homalodisca vitripennis]|nr:hypothetical protein J6590_085786 [Homalodisca vitripennis]